MIQVICDFCGQKIGKEFVHKVEIKPWFDPKTVGHVYRRDFDCCEECAKAIEHRLIMIEGNWLWHGKDPNRRYKNWGMPEPTSEQVEEYCRKRCLSIISNELMAHIIADNGESIRAIPSTYKGR